MDIDLSVLRSLESEKDISLDQAIKAIEDALLGPGAIQVEFGHPPSELGATGDGH